MYPKFIIVSQPKEMKGYLRMGICINHKDLVIGYEKVHGGGWYMIDEEKKSVVLYGSSGDYGEPMFCFLDMIDRRFKDYSFWYASSMSATQNPIDTTGVEWI